MADIMLGSNEVHTLGDLLEVGAVAPFTQLTRMDLSNVTLDDYSGWKVLNIFPSVDTGVCAASVRQFNAKAGGREGVTVLNISADLPFAHKRFCGAEGLEGVESLSSFRSSFSRDWNLEMIDGKLAGLCSRAVIVLDAENKVVYTEQVPQIAQEPNYDAAFAALS